MDIKTILLPIYNGIRAKNFFYTDIYPELADDPNIRLVIVIPPSKLEFYKKQFGRPNVIFEPLEIISESPFGVRLSAIAFNFLNTDSVRLKQRWTYLKYGKWWKFAIKRISNRIFAPFYTTQKVIRFFDKFVDLDEGVVKLLDKYKPDLVVVPDIVFPPDRVFLRAAKRKGFFVVGMIRAWDNLTSKGVIQIIPDKLIVHTNIMKEQAYRLSGVPEKDIVVTGIPNYDIFFKPRNINREQFLKQFNIPSDHKVVLCAPFLYSHVKSAQIIINELIKAIQSGRLPSNTHLLVRYRPGVPEIPKELFIKSPNLTITRPCQFFFPVKNTQMSTKDWEFSPDDLDLLMNTLYFSDVTINTMSTLTIDAAIFDKPVINVRFDADKDVQERDSVGILLKHDHYQAIENSGGVKRAWSMDELIKQTSDYLKNPALDKEGRARMVQEQVEFTDGKSGKRTADYIKSVLGNKKYSDIIK
jgi:hypothetical protein